MAVTATRPTADPRAEPIAQFADYDPGAGSRPCAEWVIWEQWHTQEDERVCPICGPRDLVEYRQGEGPQPPAHQNCRCWRAESRRE